MKKRKLLGLTAALAILGIGVSGSAHAVSYGLSYQDIQNAQVLIGNFQNATGGALAGGTTTSETSADLTGFAPDGDSVTLPRGATPPADAAPANVNMGATPRVNNVFNSFIKDGKTGNYSNGDAVVLTEQNNPGDKFAATNIAEYYIEDNAAGGSRGGNGSTTGFQLDFVIVGPGTADFQFSFDNDPYMEALLASEPGGSATASILASLTLNRAVNGLTVGTISWSPDGVNGNVDLGTIGAVGAIDVDPYSLNTSISLLSNGGPTVYDPTGGGFADGTYANWSLSIAGLQLGTYSLTVEMEERTRGNNVVPEPGILALLGIGLIGLARRRRAAV